MTADRPTDRCAWCGASIERGGSLGRPPKYCRRAHRQRAYEARRLGDERQLSASEAIVTTRSLRDLRDVVYLAEASARDAELDVVDADEPELRQIIRRLSDAIDDVVSAVPEPVASGADG